MLTAMLLEAASGLPLERLTAGSWGKPYWHQPARSRQEPNGRTLLIRLIAGLGHLGPLFE